MKFDESHAEPPADLRSQVTELQARLARAEQLLQQERQARQSAEQDRQKFNTLVENSDDFIALADLDGGLLFLNEAGRRMVGLATEAATEPLTLADCLTPEDAERFFSVELPAVKEAGRWQGESRLCHAQTGEVRNVLVNSFLVGDPRNRQSLCLATVQRDITERKRQEESIRVSEERFRQLAENTDDVFWISSIDPRRLLYVSPAYERVFGRSCDALYADVNTFLDAVHPEDRSRVESNLGTARLGGYDEVFRIVHADGAIRTVRTRAFPVRDAQGQVYRVAGLSEDITQAKQVEEELLAEQRFLEHLLQVQEGERRLVAYDIHDGFVQAVIAAMMHLQSLAAEADLSDAARQKLALPLKLLQDSIEEARRMISGLRPPIIDEQGLVAAIEYLVHESTQHTTKVLFHHAVHFDRLEPVLEGSLYRIVQEALSNVFRHSHAKLAQVTLIQTPEQLSLQIEDWGQGFDTSKTSSRQFGLRGIRERARLCGGTAAIQSTPGQGTRVCVQVPQAALKATAAR